MNEFNRGDRVSNSVYGEGRVFDVLSSDLVNVMYDTETGGSNLITSSTIALTKIAK